MIEKINVNRLDELTDDCSGDMINIIIVNESHAQCSYLKDRISEDITLTVYEYDLSENKDTHEILNTVRGIPTLISIENCGRPKFITGVSSILSNLSAKQVLA